MSKNINTVISGNKAVIWFHNNVYQLDTDKNILWRGYDKSNRFIKLTPQPDFHQMKYCADFKFKDKYYFLDWYFDDTIKVFVKTLIGDKEVLK